MLIILRLIHIIEMSNSDQKGGFGNLPNHVILIIYSWLDLGDRFTASLTCKKWAAAFQSASLWRHFSFAFRSKAHSKLLKCIEDHANDLKSVRIYIDPQIRVNCDNLCRVVTSLSRADERRLERLGIFFIADNPLMFQGNDILSSLAELFGPPDPKLSVMTSLIEVDLSGLNVAFTDITINLLASNHPSLEILNIQNTSLICKVSPAGLLNLVQKCRKLTKLFCYHVSVTDEVMLAFTEKKRESLGYLSLQCLRHDRFRPPISPSVWDRVTKSLPKLRVALHFDHTIEKETIREIMHHQIPVVQINLNVMAELETELALIDSYYSGTIEKLTIFTKGSEEFQRLLLAFVEKASKLKVLHCYCGLSQETIQKIFEIKPFFDQFTLLTEETFRAHTPQVYVGQDARSTVLDSCNYPVLEESMENLSL